MNSQKKRHQPSKSQLRIIAGQWRGRKLPFPAVDGLRPTGDRIRETLFNWLQGDVHGARCLDLFSGSGALGLEALSRGAAHTTFLELNSTACRQLRENIAALKANSAQVVQTDTLAWLKSPIEDTFDIVFLDPPFAAELWDATIFELSHSSLMADTASVYIETPRNTQTIVPTHWQLRREKFSGDICYRLYDVEKTDQPACSGDRD